jgi:hypothetical protein
VAVAVHATTPREEAAQRSSHVTVYDPIVGMENPPGQPNPTRKKTTRRKPYRRPRHPSPLTCNQEPLTYLSSPAIAPPRTWTPESGTPSPSRKLERALHRNDVLSQQLRKNQRAAPQDHQGPQERRQTASPTRRIHQMKTLHHPRDKQSESLHKGIESPPPPTTPSIAPQVQASACVGADPRQAE